MADCECLPACPFFNDVLTDMPATAEYLKAKFCLGDNSQCARYLVFKALGKAHVPVDLFPDHTERARQIIQTK